MTFTPYPKIPNVFYRDMSGSKLLVPWKYDTPEIADLSTGRWFFTEKVDGTNIQVRWDGYRVSFDGRTLSSEIPKHLMAKLVELFGGPENEGIFEQIFGEKEVILYGEGYGNKLQTTDYRDDVGFILFDVNVGGLWLERQNVEDIASKFQIEAVPHVMTDTVYEAVQYVAEHPDSIVASWHGKKFPMEGLVGRPERMYLDRRGQRIECKIKWKDIHRIDLDD